MPANDTQSLARRIAEKVSALFNGDLSHGRTVEAIIAAELEEREKKVRELIEAAESVSGMDAGPFLQPYFLKLRKALEALKK